MYNIKNYLDSIKMRYISIIIFSNFRLKCFLKIPTKTCIYTSKKYLLNLILKATA